MCHASVAPLDVAVRRLWGVRVPYPAKGRSAAPAGQNRNFSPISTCRLLFCCEPIIPKDELPSVKLGAAKTGWFRELYASARSSAFNLSWMGKVLPSARSTLLVPGLRTDPIRGATFPHSEIGR